MIIAIQLYNLYYVPTPYTEQFLLFHYVIILKVFPEYNLILYRFY